MAEKHNVVGLRNPIEQECAEAKATHTYRALVTLDSQLQRDGNPQLFFNETAQIAKQADQCLNAEQSLTSEMPDELTQKRCLKQLDTLKNIRVNPEYSPYYGSILTNFLFNNPGLEHFSTYLKSMDREISADELSCDHFIGRYLGQSLESVDLDAEGMFNGGSSSIGKPRMLILSWWMDSHNQEVASKLLSDLDKYILFPMLHAVYVHTKANIMLDAR